MKFKNYRRKYEYYFSSKKRLGSYCKIDRIGIEGGKYNIDEYISLNRKLSRSFDLIIFDFLVKYTWLTEKFMYNGNLRRENQCIFYDRSFGMFLRNYASFDCGLIRKKGFTFFGKIVPYLFELFPFFYEGDPFKEKKRYKYPYKHMGLGCLYVVVHMDERLDLLKYGDKKKMSYAEFVDYVINYINCYNTDVENKYTMVLDSWTSMHVVKNSDRKIKQNQNV